MSKDEIKRTCKLIASLPFPEGTIFDLDLHGEEVTALDGSYVPTRNKNDYVVLTTWRKGRKRIWTFDQGIPTREELATIVAFA